MSHDHPVLVPAEPNTANRRWRDDLTQFARLLAELRAVGLTPEQYAELEETTDMPAEDIDELLERAESQWQRIKLQDYSAHAFLHDDSGASSFDRRVEIQTGDQVIVHAPRLEEESSGEEGGPHPMVAVEFWNGFVRCLAYAPFLEDGKPNTFCEEVSHSFTLAGPVTAEQQRRIWREVEINSSNGELVSPVFIWEVGTPVTEIRDWFTTQPKHHALEAFTPPGV